MIIPTEIQGWRPAKVCKGGRYGHGVTYTDLDRERMTLLMSCIEANWNEEQAWLCPAWPSEGNPKTGLQIDCGEAVCSEIREIFG